MRVSSLETDTDGGLRAIERLAVHKVEVSWSLWDQSQSDITLLNEFLGVSLTYNKTQSEGRDLLWGVWAGQPDLCVGTGWALSCKLLQLSRCRGSPLAVADMCLNPEYPDVTSWTPFACEQHENPGAAVLRKITPSPIHVCWRSTWRQSSKFHLVLVEMSFKLMNILFLSLNSHK